MPKKKSTNTIAEKSIEFAPLKNFLEIPYAELEDMNLALRAKQDTVDSKKQEEEARTYLSKEKRIKAITLCFTDIEGKFQMLDYDKIFLLASAENLTFDGSSIRGFTAQTESDLRLQIDWTSLVFLPADVFGAGKVFIFANIQNREKGQYESDFRGILQQYTRELKK